MGFVTKTEHKHFVCLYSNKKQLAVAFSRIVKFSISHTQLKKETVKKKFGALFLFPPSSPKAVNHSYTYNIGNSTESIIHIIQTSQFFMFSLFFLIFLPTFHEFQ